MASKRADRRSKNVSPFRGSPHRRSTLEILNNHILKTISHEIDEDLETNYLPEVILFTSNGIHRGRTEARAALKALESELKSTSDDYEVAEFSEEYVFIERVSLGDDGKLRRIGESLMLQDGQIAVQMVHILPYEE